MATHSSFLAWRIPWKEKPGRLQSMWSHRVEHDGTCEHANVHLQTKYTVVYINHISPMSDGKCSGKSFQP